MLDVVAPSKILRPKIFSSYSEHMDQYIKNTDLDPRFKMLIKHYWDMFDTVPDINTRVGIEVECENIAYVATHHWNTEFWYLKSDGSLRHDGIEFISPALRPNQIKAALSFLLAWIQYMKPSADFSWRTSTHIHLECAGLTVNEFRNLLLLYVVFEDSLFQFAHPGRKETNIFCTPITRTNFYSLNSFIHAPSLAYIQVAFSDLNQNVRKYSALNLNHMYDFGTLEFRHLRGTNDPILLNGWIQLLLKLFKSATQIEQKELFTDISSLNTTSAYDAFTEKIFGEKLGALLFSPANLPFLSRGISLAKEVVYGNDLLNSITLSPKGGISKFLKLKAVQQRKDRLAKKKPGVLLETTPF